jgi:hypothetical protein
MPEPLQSVQQLDFIPPQDVFPSPADWRDVFIYFLLVDRFDNNQRGLRPYTGSEFFRAAISRESFAG